jgi:transcription initiation factor IIE alpha subunit
MYKSLIKRYIEKLKKEDIIKFISKNNYQVSDKEIDTIYFYIKNYTDDIINNKKEIWDKLKNDVSTNTFKELQNLYHKYIKYIN